MKGLIIKDLMCLRKQRVTYIYIVVVVVIVSIMFVLSAKFGNIGLAGTQMEEGGMSEMDVSRLSSFVLIIFMLLPLAMVGDVSSLFATDGKAGFQNVSAILPISIEKRVLAKYLTILTFFGIGVGTDAVISFIISCLTDIITFKDLFASVITGASGMFIYGALISIFIFLFGYGKENYAQSCAVLTIGIMLIIANYKKVKELFISVVFEGAEVLDVNPIEVVATFFIDKALSVLITAIIVGVISFGVSVFIAKRKRGIV